MCRNFHTRLVMITMLPITVNMAPGSIASKLRRLGEEKTWASMRLIHQMTLERPTNVEKGETRKRWIRLPNRTSRWGL